MRKPSLVFGLLALIPLTPAQAYVGPGVAAGTIAVVLGILSSIFLAFVGILWYPIKRLIRGRKRSSAEPAQPTEDAGSKSDIG